MKHDTKRHVNQNEGKIPKMDDWRKEAGRRLARAMKEREWGPADLAAAVDYFVSPQAISNYVSGFRGLKVDVAKALAQALGNVSAAYLMTLDDEPQHSQPLQPDERALLDNYNAADERGKRSIRSVADAQRPEPMNGGDHPTKVATKSS